MIEHHLHLSFGERGGQHIVTIIVHYGQTSEEGTRPNEEEANARKAIQVSILCKWYVESITRK